MPEENIVTFPINEPQVVRLASTVPTAVQGYRSEDMLYKLAGGKIMYVSREASNAIQELGIRVGENVQIGRMEKREGRSGRGVQWQIGRPAGRPQQADDRTAGPQVVPPRPAPPPQDVKPVPEPKPEPPKPEPPSDYERLLQASIDKAHGLPLPAATTPDPKRLSEQAGVEWLEAQMQMPTNGHATPTNGHAEPTTNGHVKPPETTGTGTPETGDAGKPESGDARECKAPARRPKTMEEMIAYVEKNPLCISLKETALACYLVEEFAKTFNYRISFSAEQIKSLACTNLIGDQQQRRNGGRY